MPPAEMDRVDDGIGQEIEVQEKFPGLAGNKVDSIGSIGNSLLKTLDQKGFPLGMKAFKQDYCAIGSFFRRAHKTESNSGCSLNRLCGQTYNVRSSGNPKEPRSGICFGILGR